MNHSFERHNLPKIHTRKYSERSISTKELNQIESSLKPFREEKEKTGPCDLTDEFFQN